MKMYCPVPSCGHELNEIIKDTHTFYKCPACNTRVYLDTGLGNIWEQEQAYKKLLAKLGGGSKKAGRKREKKKVRPRPLVEE